MKIPNRHPDRLNESTLLAIHRQYEKDEVVRALLHDHKLLRIENGMLLSEYQEKIDGLVTQIKALEKKYERLKVKADTYKNKFQMLYKDKYFQITNQ